MSIRRRQQEIKSREIASCLGSDEVAAELQRTVIEQIRKEKTTKVEEKMKFLKDRLPKNQRYALDLAVEKNALSWLITRPLQRYQFDKTIPRRFSFTLCLETSQNTDIMCVRRTF